MIFKFNEYGKRLSTRDQGREVKAVFDKLYDSTSNKITLDFSGIELVTNSFADELIGKKIIEVGIDNFKSKTTFINLKPFVAMCIKKAIDNRVDELDKLNSNTVAII